MSNVLDIEKQHQIRALGTLGRSLRAIEAATGVRRETVSAYLKEAGIPVRRRGGRPRAWPPNPATAAETSTDPASANPATTAAVSTDPRPTRSPQTSACAVYREVIVEALARGRNAMAIWQDLVDGHGFRHGYASVRRFIATLRAATPVEARVVITTAPGEDYGETSVMVSRAAGLY
jgi:transposase